MHRSLGVQNLIWDERKTMQALNELIGVGIAEIL